MQDYISLVQPKYLSREFLAQYTNQQSPFTTDFGLLVFLRTYSRYLEEFQRRERWWEVVMRVVEYSMSLYKGPASHEALKAEAEELYDNIFNLRLFSAGRTLWAGGSEVVKQYGESNFNCFAVETEFLTKEGLRKFSDFLDGDEVEVLTRQLHKGATTWKTAKVKNFGKAALYKITLRRGRSERIIHSTANHRWIVRSSSNYFQSQVEKTTLELVAGTKGDRIPVVRAGQTSKNSPCSIAIQHGIIFGDGTYVKKYGACRLDLQKSKFDLLPLITTGTEINQGSKGGEVNPNSVIIDRLPYNWKELPPLTANLEYLLGFLMGWFATDGSLSGGSTTLSNADKSVLEWARSTLSLLGIYTSEVTCFRETSPYDGSEKPCYSLTLYREYLSEDFFIRQSHQEEFQEGREKGYWTVASVEATDRHEEVWCVQEPETETFVLADGLLTRNCSFKTIDSIEAFAEIFYLLMVGAGAGFSVEQKYVDQLPTLHANFKAEHKPYAPVHKGMRLEYTEVLVGQDASGLFTPIGTDLVVLDKEYLVDETSTALEAAIAQVKGPVKLTFKIGDSKEGK